MDGGCICEEKCFSDTMILWCWEKQICVQNWCLQLFLSLTSCCVVVKNIQRCLYFLPREKARLTPFPFALFYTPYSIILYSTLHTHYSVLHTPLFYSILLYSILYSTLHYSILHTPLFHTPHSILHYFILRTPYSIILYSIIHYSGLHTPFPHSQILGPSGVETDTPVTFQDLYAEFNTKYAEPQRIMKFTSRRVTRRYAFDLPDVPQESEYLQVSYSAEYHAPPTNASGKTFSRVFGTTASRWPLTLSLSWLQCVLSCSGACVCIYSLEQLVLSRQLKGPCWLHIVQPGQYKHTLSSFFLPPLT